jgi:hypothetical protein
VWLTTTFIGKLASPMYSVINGMQVGMVLYPKLASQYGDGAAVRSILGAYSAIGIKDVTGLGVTNTGKAIKGIKNAFLDTDDVIGSIKQKLQSQPDGSWLIKLIEHLQSRGAMSSGGFEIDNTLGDSKNRFKRGLAGLDRVARQLPSMVEDVNRAVSGIATYRLARRSGLNHDEAVAKAFDNVMNTQGDYSAINAPRFFNKSIFKPAFQFKKYSQMMLYLLGDVVGKHLDSNATDAEKREVRKFLYRIVGVQMATAGALSLPGVELLKIGAMLAAIAGFGDGWDSLEEEWRKLLTEVTGSKTAEEMFNRGILSRLVGIDLSSRLSLADMLVFGEPKRFDKDNISSFLANIVAGAPGSTVWDIYEGQKSIREGDLAKGFGKMIPFKMVSDLSKSIGRYNEGKQTAVEIGLNTFGVRTGRQAEAGRETGNRIREARDRDDRRKELTRQYLRSTSGAERLRLRRTIKEFNEDVPLRYKIFPNGLDKVRARMAKERVN